MIVLNLSCPEEHHFEGWFASAEAFEAQQKRGLVTCPVCGSPTISLKPTAPYVNRGASAGSAVKEPKGRVAPKDLAAAAMAVFQHLLESTEDVGKRFADEARSIHRGDAEERPIRGVTTREETRDLLDEGIGVLPLPIPPKDGMH